MEYKQLKQIIEDAAKKAGIMEYEVYYTEDRGMDVSVFQSEIKEFSSAESRGVCFRCRADGKIGYASTELMDEEELRWLNGYHAMVKAELEAFLTPEENAWLAEVCAPVEK